MTKKFPSGQYFYNTVYRIRIIVYIEYCRVSVPSSELGPPPFLPWTQRGEEQLAGEEVGGSNSDDWTESLAFCLLCAVHCTFCPQECGCYVEDGVESPLLSKTTLQIGGGGGGGWGEGRLDTAHLFLYFLRLEEGEARHPLSLQYIECPNWEVLFFSSCLVLEGIGQTEQRQREETLMKTLSARWKSRKAICQRRTRRQLAIRLNRRQRRLGRQS
jgi:hypothetical protein